MKREEIGWLAGVIDGEGSISLSRGGKKGGTDRTTCHPLVTITNTNLPLLEKAEKIFADLGVVAATLACHDNRYAKLPTGRSFQSTRPCYRLSIARQSDLTKVLSAALPSLVAKRIQALLMLEYLRNEGGVNRIRANRRRDVEIANMISSLNRGIADSVETARPPRVVNAPRQMTQSDLYGDVQSAAEMPAPAEDGVQ